MRRLVIILLGLTALLLLSSCNEHRYRQGYVHGSKNAPMNPATESRYYPLR